MHNQLQKAIEISRRTGDRLIIFDSESNEAFAIMPLSKYEELVSKKNLTDNEFVDNINSNIPSFEDDNILYNEGTDYESEMSFEPDFGASNEGVENGEKKWGIPKRRRESAEEVIEEDRQYLEEINF